MILCMKHIDMHLPKAILIVYYPQIELKTISNI